MTTSKAVAPVNAAPPRVSLLAKMAAKYSVDADKMRDTLAATAFKGERDKPVTNEQMMALLIVADQYNLNPWLKEIYAFPDKGGGIVPVIGVDGWIRMINEHPQFAGMELASSNGEADESEGAIPSWMECRIFRKDRERPTVVREYFEECKRDTGPWKSHPRRMLRHKAIIQCARIAFGFSGVYDPDEGERVRDAIDVTPQHAKPVTAAPKSKNGNTAPNEVPIEAFKKALAAEGIAENEFLEQFGAESFEAFPLDKVQAALDWIERVGKE